MGYFVLFRDISVASASVDQNRALLLSLFAITKINICKDTGKISVNKELLEYNESRPHIEKVLLWEYANTDVPEFFATCKRENGAVL